MAGKLPAAPDGVVEDGLDPFRDGVEVEGAFGVGAPGRSHPLPPGGVGEQTQARVGERVGVPGGDAEARPIPDNSGRDKECARGGGGRWS